MSTATDYAQPRRIDWSWWGDVATVIVVMFACGAADSLADAVVAVVRGVVS